jgi:hypothetical protein
MSLADYSFAIANFIIDSCETMPFFIAAYHFIAGVTAEERVVE